MTDLTRATDVASAEREDSSPLLRLHDSVLQNILQRADIQSRISVSMTCRRLARVTAEHPPSVVDLSSDGVHPEACRRYIECAKGAVVTLTTARQKQRTACDAASARRFATGLRCTQVVPYTSGPSALRLASCLPRLTTLALHEATCCLGGMTDDLAAAVATHCPLLSCLEVAFTPYSLPAEFFTDAGLLSLAEGCPRLASLSLANCGAITDRSLYAVASHCRALESLELGGYHELITDYGTVVLFQACTSLRRVLLSGKLRRVTDESAEALAAGSGGSLREVKLTRSMGDRALATLGAHCRALNKVDCCKCEQGSVTAAGVAHMIRGLTAQRALAAAAAPQTPEAGAAAGAANDAAPAGNGTIGGATLSSGGGAGGDGGVLRVVLPRGVTAAEVLRLGPDGSGGGGDGAGRRAMALPSAAAAAAGPLLVPRAGAPRSGDGVAAAAGGPGAVPRGVPLRLFGGLPPQRAEGSWTKRPCCGAPEALFEPEVLTVRVT